MGRWILGKKNCCVKRGEGEDNNEVLREIRDTCVHVMCVCVHTCMYVCQCVYTRDTTVLVVVKVALSFKYKCILTNKKKKLGVQHE